MIYQKSPDEWKIKKHDNHPHIQERRQEIYRKLQRHKSTKLVRQALHKDPRNNNKRTYKHIGKTTLALKKTAYHR